MASRLLSISLFLMFAGGVHASDYCPSDFFVHGKCVPDAVVTEALQEASNKAFVDVMKALYEQAALATNTQNNVFELSKDAGPAWAEIRPGEPLFFGAQEIETARNQQLTVFTSYCSNNSASIKRVDITGMSKQITAFCLDKNGDALAGLVVLPPQRDRLYDTKKMFQAHYLSPSIAQKILDFWANIKLGDKTNMGMVIEVKPPIVKVQIPKGEERWFEVETLLPKDLY